MPRYYPNGKRCQLNITLDADAFQRAYGHLLSRMLRDFQRARDEQQLCERLETCVSTLEGKIGTIR